MSQWLGSWDSLATGTYRPGIEMTEDYTSQCLEDAYAVEDEEPELHQNRVVRLVGYIGTSVFVVLIAGILMFPEVVSSIF